MAGIQAGINQLIGQGAVLAHLSPGLRARAEDRAALAKIKHKEKALGEQYALSMTDLVKAEKSLAKGPESPESFEEIMTEMAEGQNLKNAATDIADVTKQINEAAKQKYDLQPTPEAYGAVKHTRIMAEGARQAVKDITESKHTRDEALRRMMQKGQESVNQKYSFKQLIEDIAKVEREGYPNE